MQSHFNSPHENAVPDMDREEGCDVPVSTIETF